MKPDPAGRVATPSAPRIETSVSSSGSPGLETEAARPPRPPGPAAARTGLRTGAWATGLGLLLVASVVVAVTIGPAGLSPADVWASVLAHLGIGEPTLSPLRDGIVWELRMPRVLAAAS